MLEDSLSFGPRKITDPETGESIYILGYNVEANQGLLYYMSVVGETKGKYYECLKDLFILK